MIKPDLDYIIVIKHEPKTILHLDNTNRPNNMFAFEIVAVGPGRWEHGIFIKTTHKVGEMVFINGPVNETNYLGEKYLWARDKDVCGHVEGDK